MRSQITNARVAKCTQSAWGLNYQRSTETAYCWYTSLQAMGIMSSLSLLASLLWNLMWLHTDLLLFVSSRRKPTSPPPTEKLTPRKICYSFSLIFFPFRLHSLLPYSLQQDHSHPSGVFKSLLYIQSLHFTPPPRTACTPSIISTLVQEKHSPIFEHSLRPGHADWNPPLLTYSLRARVSHLSE